MLTNLLFVACFFSHKIAVFPPGDYVIHDRGAVDGYDIVQQESALIPAPLVERRCLPLAPVQASVLLHSLKRGDSCTMENVVITCSRAGGTWTF